ncbi:iron-containing alcohol dehydrogenase family protein [Cupriavidus respiraculi]|uniref:Lactaldehyde reductase n=1 Tax=Cupriavidus respiraculi TaxID=195930 RepID=A0ABM8WHW2_9BURK|nr:iron-containing alcohol dehydrogenase [Cupriavidus respiraculi]CAG9166684.1 Lactaldehyde reductase [Cupriavidus respiraculi]
MDAAHTSVFDTAPGHFATRWPGEAVFGAGCVEQLPLWARRAGVRRPLLLTDAGLAATGLPARVAHALGRAGIAPVAHDDVAANPAISHVMAAAQRWRANGCDGLIALGGGSVIDVGKVLCALLCSDLPLGETIVQGDAALTRPTPPFAAVPTTAGTGSESTVAALVKDEAGRKHVLRSHRCRPQWVALDPLLTLTVPRAVTACTGFDVLMHALGAATNRASHPLGETLATDALRRAIAALPAVLARPDDTAARADMMLASYLAGVAMSLRGVDGIHGLCTPLEAVVDAPHAHVLAVVCEPLMRFNVVSMTARYAAVARACALVAPAVPDTLAARALIETICALRDLAQLPRSLDALGVLPADMTGVHDAAEANASARLNGRPLSRDDIVALYAAMRRPPNLVR